MSGKKQLDEIGINVNIITDEQLDNVMTMLIMVFDRLKPFVTVYNHNIFLRINKLSKAKITA